MTLNNAYSYFEEAQKKALERFNQEIASLRSGRVKTSLIESIMVEHYGTRTPLNGVGSITVSDARTIVISPWDPGALPAIAKAIVEAEIGIQPIEDGKVVRLVFPSLTEETRERTIKTLGKYAEETRVRLRQARDEALKMIRDAKQEGDLTEDDFYSGKEKLDSMIGKANDEIEAIVARKEEEIRKV